MKFCSVCLKCYEDSEAICAVDKGHGSLVQVGRGSCSAIKGYRIESRLESLSPFTLYRAKNLESKESVLIRFISRGELSPKVAMDLREAVRLDHPSLARVLEWGELENKDRFIVLEDVAGESLSDLLKESSPIDERPAIAIACRIAEGLEALHAAGLVHRAVNPSNVYFSGANFESVKLHHFDFGGIAQKAETESDDDSGNASSVLPYFSPEQFTGEEIDFRSDIYSLATVIYQMLLGRLPFDSSNRDTISNYVFNESDVWGLHIELRALIAHILRQSFQRRLDLRPRSTQNFVRQLRHLELLATRIEQKSKEAHDASTIVRTAPLKAKTLETDPGSMPDPGSMVAVVPAASVEPALYSREVEPESDGPLASMETEPKVKEKRTRHLTIGDTEYLESIEYLPVPVVAKPTRHVKGSEPVAAVSLQIQNAALDSVRSPASRAVFFAAGLLISAVCGGVVTAGFLRLESDLGSV
ncbi:MAG: serine/threonine protein kinase, partial [Acidobacteriota bacterium]|nr:serine/threonine protein kinase [Acidobacteriota bacterium]